MTADELHPLREAVMLALQHANGKQSPTPQARELQDRVWREIDKLERESSQS